MVENTTNQTLYVGQTQQKLNKRFGDNRNVNFQLFAHLKSSRVPFARMRNLNFFLIIFNHNRDYFITMRTAIFQAF